MVQNPVTALEPNQQRQAGDAQVRVHPDLMHHLQDAKQEGERKLKVIPSQLVSWYFEPGQPQRITSWLKVTPRVSEKRGRHAKIPDKQADREVNWCFEPSKSQRIISRLKTNFNLSPNHFAYKSLNHKICFCYHPRETSTLYKPQIYPCANYYDVK